MSADGHFEAIKIGYRQSKDGMVVSFAIHPNDVPGILASAKLGTRYMIGWAQIGDDEQTGGVPPGRNQSAAGAAATANDGTQHSAEAPAAPKRKLSDMQPSQRAALLCRNLDFQAWAARQPDGFKTVHLDLGDNEAWAVACAAWLRERCGVKSRAQLDDDAAAHQTFCRIEEKYRTRNDPPPREDDR